MLSKNEMVKFRKAIERMYDSLCTVIVFQEYEKPNGVTAFREEVLFEDEPCHVSQTPITRATNSNGANEVEKIINLFISPDLTIPAGSKIIVTYCDISYEYKSSGVPSHYDAFQQIQLELVNRWV